MPKPEQQSLFLRTPDERQRGLDAVRAIKGNLDRMGDPRFMGTEQRKRLGAESSHLGMAENETGRLRTRQHLAESHGFTDSDFGLFGDPNNLSASMLNGAHGQEHDFNPDVNHTHVGGH